MSRSLGVSRLSGSQDLSQLTHRRPQLVIAQVRSWAEAEQISSRVDVNAPIVEKTRDVFRTNGANREEAAASLVRHRFHPRYR